MGLMRYNRLNFGISSAAEIFHNVIRETLEGIDRAINISDDILVFGKTHNEHNRNLWVVFQRLRKKGLTLNKSKCEYSKDKLEFFNLGTCSRKTAYRQTRRNQPWCWTAGHDGSVSQLKEKLVRAPVTEISVDASPVGLAAIFSHVDQKTEEELVITCASHSLKHEGALYKGISFASSGSLETGTMHFYASGSNRELISLRDRTRNYKCNNYLKRQCKY